MLPWEIITFQYVPKVYVDYFINSKHTWQINLQWKQSLDIIIINIRRKIKSYSDADFNYILKTIWVQETLETKCHLKERLILRVQSFTE